LQVENNALLRASYPVCYYISMVFSEPRQDRVFRRAHRIVRRRLCFMIDNYSLIPLSGGASTRRYFRLILPRLARFAPAVLMVWDKRFRNSHRDFIQLQRLFSRILLPVPAVYEDLAAFGAAILQDLGDSTLCDVMPFMEGDDDAKEEFYRQAIDYVVLLQTRAHVYADNVRAYARAFDEKKLLCELDFMMRHFAGSLLGYRPQGAASKALKTFFTALCRRIAALPRVLCHRDYHSQNLMLMNERLFIIDFQDARLGPHVYDIVSLLRDSYSELSDNLVERLFDYYIERHPSFEPSDRSGIECQFNLMALQRHLKHLGTFGRQASLGRRFYLSYVPLTLRYLESNLPRFPEYSEAAVVLSDIFARAPRVVEKEE
jgi:aminoglycoside/choline kinase family phosphotransferase